MDFNTVTEQLLLLSAAKNNIDKIWDYYQELYGPREEPDNRYNVIKFVGLPSKKMHIIVSRILKENLAPEMSCLLTDIFHTIEKMSDNELIKMANNAELRLYDGDIKKQILEYTFTSLIEKF